MQIFSCMYEWIFFCVVSCYKWQQFTSLRDGSMMKGTCCSWRPNFSSQATHLAGHNCLQLQCLLLDSTGTSTHVQTPSSHIPIIKGKKKLFLRKKIYISGSLASCYSGWTWDYAWELAGNTLFLDSLQVLLNNKLHCLFFLRIRFLFPASHGRSQQSKIPVPEYSLP